MQVGRMVQLVGLTTAHPVGIVVITAGQLPRSMQVWKVAGGTAWMDLGVVMNTPALSPGADVTESGADVTESGADVTEFGTDVMEEGGLRS